MSNALVTVLDRWIEDEGFRASMRADPVATMEKATGVTLDDSDREDLAEVDWTLSDEELEGLFSKAFRSGC